MIVAQGVLAQTYLEWSGVINVGVVLAALGLMAKAVSQWTRVEDKLSSGSERMTRIENSLEEVRKDTKNIPTLTLRVENLERTIGKRDA